MTSDSSLGKPISELQQMILVLCFDALPLELLEEFESMLVGQKVPVASTPDSEIYGFYEELLPDGTIKLMERLGGLNYPILNHRDLADQLGANNEGLGDLENELISGLTLPDFPLVGLPPVYDVAIFRILKRKLQGCQRSYFLCRKIASRFAIFTGTPEERKKERERREKACRSQRDKCTDKKLTAVFSVLAIQELINSRIV